MAKGTFGEHLKRERELREVTVHEIASATRIAAKFLEALENEQWEKLPGGVFGRGFVRSIARYLGLSEENLLSEYDLARGESTTPAPQKPEERIPSTPKWIPALAVVVLIGMLIGIVIGGRYAWRWYAAHRAAKKASAVVGLPSATPARNILVNASSNSPVRANDKWDSLELSIAASTTTHVRALADGSLVYHAELPVTRNLQFSTNDKFAVTAADSSALLLQLNGQVVTSNGTPGTSGTILLTSKNLGQAASGTTQR
jgi:cytoskeletal protein RodZ